jgi:hypothetical protein
MPENTKRDETEARDALDRDKAASTNQSDTRERHLDKTIEDSFPASDPPSTDPNPAGKD